MAHQLGKLQPVIENPGDNPWKRLRLDWAVKPLRRQHVSEGLISYH